MSEELQISSWDITFPHTQADGDGSDQKIRGQLSSSAPGGAVKLSDMPEGIEVVAAVALLLLHSHPLCVLGCWPPTMLYGDRVGQTTTATVKNTI